MHPLHNTQHLYSVTVDMYDGLWFMQVTELYSSSSWQHINEHLHEVLGRQCAELSDKAGALA